MGFGSLEAGLKARATTTEALLCELHRCSGLLAYAGGAAQRQRSLTSLCSSALQQTLPPARSVTWTGGGTWPAAPAWHLGRRVGAPAQSTVTLQTVLSPSLFHSDVGAAANAPQDDAYRDAGDCSGGAACYRLSAGRSCV